jgi:hypothetical protein
MKSKLIFEGTCWKFGHNIPTDLITPTHIMFKAWARWRSTFWKLPIPISRSM